MATRIASGDSSRQSDPNREGGFLAPLPHSWKGSMTSDARYTPRLNVDIRQDQRDNLDKLIPWGQRREIISSILDDLIKILKPLDERDRRIFIACIVARKVGIEDFMELSDDP